MYDLDEAAPHDVVSKSESEPSDRRDSKESPCTRLIAVKAVVRCLGSLKRLLRKSVPWFDTVRKQELDQSPEASAEGFHKAQGFLASDELRLRQKPRMNVGQSLLGSAPILFYSDTMGSENSANLATRNE